MERNHVILCECKSLSVSREISDVPRVNSDFSLFDSLQIKERGISKGRRNVRDLLGNQVFFQIRKNTQKNL